KKPNEKNTLRGYAHKAYPLSLYQSALCESEFYFLDSGKGSTHRKTMINTSIGLFSGANVVYLRHHY
ncbi:MAG: hypothetical protein SOZ18_07735, partial [Phocaeicola sp.]|nr:hypothetical protein [Phocaeicola sp.]